MQIHPEFRENVKRYFTFSKREYKASLLLIAFAFLCHYYGALEDHFFPSEPDPQKLRTEAAAFENALAPADASNDQNVHSTRVDSLFAFDPNTITSQEWVTLGLTPKQAHTILNFRNKGGSFRIRSDLQKIYGFPPTIYQKLEPYILLPKEKTTPERTPQAHTVKNKIPQMVELNSADSNDLDKLPGIGFGFARRIIRYRESLGGYLYTGQLMEVFGFRQSLLDSIAPFLTVDITRVRLLHVNSATVDELKKHPYLRYRLANAIVNYRAQHGPFQTVDDLKNVVLIDAAALNRLKPYITVD